MLYKEDEVGEFMELYWDDLSLVTKEAILEFLGENGNYDVVPIAQIYRTGA